MADDISDDENAELRKIFDELPEWIDVPLGDGEVVKVRKRNITPAQLQLVIDDIDRQAKAALEEATNVELLRAEAERRGCRPDQPMGEVFPEGLQVALARLRAGIDGELQ